MNELDLRLSAATAQDTGSFRLMELPPELYQIIESTTEKTASLCIKGHPTEDAVLCTSEKTYAVRSVVLSNTVLVVTPSRSDPDGTVHIRDQLHEILELVPVVPKLHKLSILLRDMEYDEGDEDRQATMPKYSYEQARREIQASEAEFVRGLKERRILVLEGQLRPIAPAHLSTILELLLNYLISLSLSHLAAAIEELVSALADEHEIPRAVSNQVISWFGDVKEGLWKMDADAVIRGLGVGILRHHRHNPISENEFLKKWKNVVGDTFEPSVKLSLLLGDYLRNLSSDGGEATLTYFPSSALPVDPAARFVELFLTRQRWKHEEIEHFLRDIAVNSKERDKLLLKHARALTDTEGVWYTARVSYNN
ncbi:sister chromatid cohesion protein Dcc1 [Suillus subalutaceus]|uniref:sister chromatid cohesion protein Dcc1 n=1 Tax=Suillus subalutaceus TaxID=48586 RepID=UPI001B87F456|nr:sister chromatid cohesion protein Dcc1 [Suillus subalutaceus]KAG1862584.1 sister chromatid cohesion protein Dcc1 [Suillus subalutaceus]